MLLVCEWTLHENDIAVGNLIILIVSDAHTLVANVTLCTICN